MNIGKAIRKVRKDRAMNQKVLANGLGISQTYVSLIEKGHKTPSIEVLEKMSEFLGIPLPIIFWFGLRKEDLSEGKQYAFGVLNSLINEVFNSNNP